jgi:hypothetical protein
LRSKLGWSTFLSLSFKLGWSTSLLFVQLWRLKSWPVNLGRSAFPKFCDALAGTMEVLGTTEDLASDGRVRDPRAGILARMVVAE